MKKTFEEKMNKAIKTSPIWQDGPHKFFGSLRIRDEDPVTALLRRMTVDQTNCWILKANEQIGGYHRFRLNKKQVFSHRFMYETFFGPIPKGKFACHKCDVRNCINPAHIFIGTAQENLSDMVKKGRSLTGEKNNKSKITADDVINLRNKYKSGKYTFESLGKEYGITKSAARFIVIGKNWSHIKEGLKNG